MLPGSELNLTSAGVFVIGPHGDSVTKNADEDGRHQPWDLIVSLPREKSGPALYHLGVTARWTAPARNASDLVVIAIAMLATCAQLQGSSWPGCATSRQATHPVKKLGGGVPHESGRR